MTLRGALFGIAIAVVASACSLIPAIQQEATTPCIQMYSKDLCLAIIDVAAAEVGKNRGDVADIVILPNPPPPQGSTQGAASPIRVRIALKDGSTHETGFCGGVSMQAACLAEPRLNPRSVIGGYIDDPCQVESETPGDCATPFPTLGSDSLAKAAPVVVDTLSIPIDHVGFHKLSLGDGSLPNGVLSEASFEFADPWPDDVALRGGGAWLALESLEPDGKPFGNYYQHGWRPGVERVRVVLTFEVLWFAPGATLEIRNVVVR